jgi:hypothetical protein
MRDLGDLDLYKPQRRAPSQEPRRPAGPLRAVLAVLVLAAAAALLWTFWPAKKAPPVDVRTTTPSAIPQTGERPARVEGENIPLPPLADTDALVRTLVGKLSSHPRVAAWLTTDQLIRNFTVSVINVADGRTPSRHLRAIRPSGTFAVTNEGGVLVVDPASYRRYDDYADAVAALDAEGIARLYVTLGPRIEEASSELGQPGGFDPVLERAILELLKTPVVEGRVALTPKGLGYEYADASLQSLSAAQRQLLRMGPRNVQIVQAKLREIAPHLGIALPAAD